MLRYLFGSLQPLAFERLMIIVMSILQLGIQSTGQKRWLA